MSDFVTIYTDASFRKDSKKAVIAFRAKSSLGAVSGSEEIESHDVHDAEMRAILLAVKSCNEKLEGLTGFFVNCDNLQCVQRFWHFKQFKKNPLFDGIHQEIMKIVGERWIRTKHVRAHTGKKDIRSYMNRVVDKMTRATK